MCKRRADEQLPMQGLHDEHSVDTTDVMCIWYRILLLDYLHIIS